MARDIGEGYVLLNATTLKRMTGEELKQLRFEVDRILTGIRGEAPPLDDVQALSARNRKIARLNSAVLMINNHVQMNRMRL